MRNTDINKKQNYGDEAPRVKDFIIVLVTFLLVVVLSWLAYYKFHWIH